MKKTAIIKISKAILIGLFIMLLCAFQIYMYRYIPINSDFSNLVLEANDILHGNPFLSHWNSTGITFLTTDLLYYIFGSAIGGISTLSYRIASGLMYTAVVLAGFLCCEPSKRNKFNILFYFLVCLIPGFFALDVFRAHTGAAIFAFFSFWFSNYYILHEKRIGLIGVFFAVMLGSLGDAETLIIAVAPIILFSIYQILIKKSDKPICLKKGLWLLSTIIFAVVIAKILDLIYFAAGGMVRNSFLGTRSFVPIEQWGEKIILYIKSIFMIGDAAFFGTKMMSLYILKYIVNSLFVILGFILVFRHFCLFFRGEDNDFISVCLSSGIIIVALIFILTDSGVDVNSSRYVAYSWVGFFVLIVRDWNTIIAVKGWKPVAISSLLILSAFCSFGFHVFDVAKASYATPIQAELGKFLSDNSLTQGYASFWNSSSVTVLTENKVKVRQITGDKYRCNYMNWFSKMDWYQNEEAYFIITEEQDAFGVTPEHAINWCGEPDKKLEFRNYQIFVYDYDISSVLHINALRDHKLTGYDYNWNENVQIIDNKLNIKPNGIVYGPYLPISKGGYKIICDGESLENLDLDVNSNNIGIIQTDINSRTYNRNEYIVFIPQDIQDLEIRLFNYSGNDILIKEVSVTSIK